MSDEEAKIRLDERKRAEGIARSFFDKHTQSYKEKLNAGNKFAFIEKDVADACRLIANTISGHTALSHTLNYTDEQLIKNEHKDGDETKVETAPKEADGKRSSGEKGNIKDSDSKSH